MSLINQMLQDLESRRTKSAPSDGAALNDLIWPGGQTASARASSLLEQISRSPALRLAALAGTSVLAAVIIWGAWRILAPHPAAQPVAQVQAPAAAPPAVSAPVEATAADTSAPVTATPGTETPAAAVAPDPPPASPPSPPVTQIQALRLSVLPDHTRLVLDASAPITHRLSVQSEYVVIDLEHAALDQPLPVFDLSNSLLKQVQAEPQGEQNLRLTLTLKAAAQAKSLVLGPDQDYGHRLVIDLYPEGVKGDSDLAVQGSGSATAPTAPSRPAASTAARSLKKARALSAAEQAEQAWQDGAQLLQQGKPEAAEPRLRQALVLDAQHLKAREALVDALLKQARAQEAEAVLTEGIRLKPDYLLFTKLYARVLVDQGDTPAALAVLEGKAASATQDIEYQAFLAALYQRMERHNDAISAYRKALASQPQQGVWWMGLGISLEATQQPAEALEAYRHAQATGSLSPAVFDFVKGRISTLKAQVSG
ncbi:MAG: tetratricopeptide repeat protein [Gammaproteobacteria bacterium]|nr:tetratricopeptide repeat protein [Gammaproteobacteria bacterium]